MKMKKLLLLSGLILMLSMATFAQTAAEWNKQGVEHSKKFDFKQAYECFTKAIELKPDFAEAYYNRATVWFELPANTYPNTDGCDDLKKAKSLGFKVKDDKMKEFGCL
jgi:tetratricopeptide (TPR) repeat protein